jgi:hypothetical protein
MTGFATAKAAIRAFIEANWTALPVAWQNESFERPRDGDGNALPWVYIEILSTNGDGSAFGSIGKRVKTDTGLVAAHFFYPVGTGDADATAMATQFGEMLQLRSIGTAPAPRMESPMIDGGGSGDDDGLYFRVSSSIPFRISYTA